MKKTISILLTFLLLFAMLFVFTGCSNKKLDECKAAIEEYYENFKDNDADDILDLFDDDFIDYLGGEEDALVIMSSRIAILGEDVEYSIVGTSYNKDGSDIMVVIEVEAQYDRDEETYEEHFQFENINDEMLITEASLEKEKVVEDIPQQFVDAYNQSDTEGLPKLFADAYFNYFTEDELYAMMDNFWLVLGSIEEYELTDEYAWDHDIEEDDVQLVYELYYNIESEKGEAELWIDLCLEDNQIKIYDIMLMPTFVQEKVDKFFGLIEKSDYDEIILMYDDIFFQHSEGGPQDWIDLLQIISEYGTYSWHQIYYWEYYETQLDDGTPIIAVEAYIDSQFGETLFIHDLLILMDTEDHLVAYHSIEIEEE